MGHRSLGHDLVTAAPRYLRSLTHLRPLPPAGRGLPWSFVLTASTFLNPLETLAYAEHCSPNTWGDLEPSPPSPAPALLLRGLRG